MKRLLEGLSPSQLEALAAGVRRGAPSGGAAPGGAQSSAPQPLSEAAAQVTDLRVQLGDQAAAALLSVLATERRATDAVADRRVELVWSGPERDGAGTRDTAVVVRELISRADHDILLSGYAVFGGKAIFAPLAELAAARPGLRVRLFLNVMRPKGDLRSAAEVAADFRRALLKDEWPGGPVPEIYYDPRALHPDPAQRAVLHAKCIVVDGLRALVTSANLTEAAQTRNIEAGVLVEDEVFAKSLRVQFDDLVARGKLLAIHSLPSPLGE